MRRGRIKAFATVTAAAVALTGATALAVVATGNPVRSVPLNDSGVWVTNDVDGIFGRQDNVAMGLDALVIPQGGGGAGHALDIVQDGETVVGYDMRQSQLIAIDPLTLEQTDGEIEHGSRISMAGGTLAVFSPSTGKIWATRYTPGQVLDNLGALAPQNDPVASIDKATAAGGGAMTVTETGSVIAVDSAGHRVRVDPTDSGFAKPQQTDVGRRGAVALSAVGDHVVVVDPATGTVQVDDGPRVDAGAKGIVVQQPGPDRPAVLLASERALISVPLTGGTREVLYSAADGAPASPIVLGDCSYAAWSGTTPKVTQACGDQAPAERAVPRESAQKAPVFRTNQGQIVLNDSASGQVYDPASERRVDNWNEARPAASDTSNPDKTDNRTTHKLVIAGDYVVEGRSGRVNVIHPIDNAYDTGKAILTISGIDRVTPRGASAVVLADGQSVGVTIPPGARKVSFQAVISNGYKDKESMSVTVRAVKDSTNSAPTALGGPPAGVTVAAGGRIVIPATPKWRDKQSDPVIIKEASAEHGTVSITPDGTSLDYAAAANSTGSDTIRLTMTDGGRSGDVTSRLPVAIPGRDDTDSVPPTPEPDVARMAVGGQAVSYPLLNDLPGADPNDPEATLTLLDVSAPSKDADKITVTPDLATGMVTATSTTPGTYLLDYQAKFGGKSARGTIRVDVTDKATSDQPVTGPDTAVAHGQAPVLIDVIANDTDPHGRVLTVRSAKSQGPVQAAVVGGRWLRIVSTAAVDARSKKPRAATAQVTYDVTADGATFVTGTVAVTLLPELTRDLPVTTADTAAVRTGDSVRVPVIANDTSPGGSMLTLSPTVEGAKVAGQLPVTDVADPKSTDVGTAYVSGSDIRYFAPAGVTAARTVVIPYVATTPAGDAAGGMLTVTIQPPPTEKNADAAPTPADIEARAASGETITIPVTPSGGDPDGDSTIVAGIASAPKLGRIIGFSPTSLTYQAYPTGETGTDVFRYVVSDPFGEVGTATVRVAVIPPQPPQPPVAIPDQITAAPGAHVTINPVANDLVSRGDSIALQLLRDGHGRIPGGASLPSGGLGPVTALAPKKGAAPNVVGYAVTGLAGTSPAGAITIRSQAGFQNPPVVYDVVAPLTDKDTTSVDVLARAYDPDGESRKLTVKADDPAVTVDGGTLTIPVKSTPQAIGFIVTDESGATSAAVAYVGAAGSGGPYVPKGRVIAVPRNGRTTAKIADFVVSPSGKSLSVSKDKGAVVATPRDGLTLGKSTAQSIELKAGENYNGPAAVVVDVLEGASTTPTTVSIPVQVGPSRPILRSCPTDTFSVSALGDPLELDITRLCHVWIPEGSAANSIRYAASWAGGTELRGVRIGAAADERVITLTADSGAPRDQKGTLEIRFKGSDEVVARLAVAVKAAEPLTVTPVTRDHVKAGESVSVDLATSVTSPLKTPQIAVRLLGQGPASVSSVRTDGAVLTVTPAADATGRIAIPVQVTDDATNPGRWVDTAVTLAVFGVPDKPTGVAAIDAAVNETVQLDWNPGSANGAPVDYYEVESSDHRTQKCPAAPCSISGLPVGQTVTFRVHAHNEAGFSDWSESSPEVTVDVKPDPVTNFAATPTGQDGEITLSWNPASTKGSSVEGYRVSGPVTAQPGASATSVTVQVPEDGVTYPFTIVAFNKAGDSVSATTKASAYGPPTLPSSVSVSPGSEPQTAFVSWPAGDPHDAGELTYTLKDQSGAILGSGEGLLSQTVSVIYGQSYTFSVWVENAHHLSAGPVSSTEYLAAGEPGDWAAAPVIYDEGDGSLSFNVTVPSTNGGVGTLQATASGRDGDSTRVDLSPLGEAGGYLDSAITGLVNGEPYTVTLTVCNDHGDCKSSPPSEKDTPYGSVSITSFTASVVDGHIEYDVAVNANGRWASIVVTSDKGDVLLSKSCFDSCDWGMFPWAPDAGKYILTARITRNFDQQQDSRDITLTIDAPPPPESVTVTRGSETGGTECGTAPCYRITYTAENFAPGTICGVTADPKDGFAQSNPSPYAPVTDLLIGSAGAGVIVTVTCNGVSDSGRRPNLNIWRFDERTS